jgi:GTP-binding protein of the ras superfamily involved in termination of M-phase
MVNYVEGMFEESYIETLGVHFMDKSITLKNNKITFNIWDLGGQKTFINMLPLVCKDAGLLCFCSSEASH